MSWYAYIIYSINGNKTYNGMTNNLERRLRQHKGIIKGGAKATSCANDWKYLAYLTGFKDKINCLSCEWRIKHPDNKKRKDKQFWGINGRINTLNHVLALDMWTKKCVIKNDECEYILYIDSEFGRLLDFLHAACRR